MQALDPHHRKAADDLYRQDLLKSQIDRLTVAMSLRIKLGMIWTIRYIKTEKGAGYFLDKQPSGKRAAFNT
jgi:hypothetical protein